MTFLEGLGVAPEWLDFGGDPDHDPEPVTGSQCASSDL